MVVLESGFMDLFDEFHRSRTRITEKYNEVKIGINSELVSGTTKLVPRNFYNPYCKLLLLSNKYSEW